MAGNYPQRFGPGPAFPKRFPVPSQSPQHAGALGQNRHPHPNYPPNSGGQVIGGMDRVGIFAQFDSSGSAESVSSGQSRSSASSTTNSSQAYATSSSSGAQTVKSRSHEPQGQGSDWQSGADSSQGGKQLSSEDQGVERADCLIKGSKTGTSLSDFLNKSKKAKKAGVSSGPSVTVSKVSLSEFIWDRDGGKSWDDIKEKFGLTNDESGVHLINMDQPKSDTNMDQKTYDGNKTNNDTDKAQQVSNMTRTSQSDAGTTKTGSIRSDQSESGVIQTGQSDVEAEEISLSDFIWDHESGKSWESIKEKFGLNSDESVLLPVETNTNRSGSSTPLKRSAGDSKQSKTGGPNPKVLKTSLVESVSSSNQQGSREPLKRKSGLGDGDGAKKQKMSTRLAVQGEYPECQRQTCLHDYQPGQTKPG